MDFVARTHANVHNYIMLTYVMTMWPTYGYIHTYYTFHFSLNIVLRERVCSLNLLCDSLRKENRNVGISK